MTASPKQPADMNWAILYPAYAVKQASGSGKEVRAAIDESRAIDQAREQLESRAITQDVEIADIGCGFGGLLFALATTFPHTLSLGTVSLLSILNPKLISLPKVWKYASPLPNTFRRRYVL